MNFETNIFLLKKEHTKQLNNLTACNCHQYSLPAVKSQINIYIVKIGFTGIHIGRVTIRAKKLGCGSPGTTKDVIYKNVRYNL